MDLSGIFSGYKLKLNLNYSELFKLEEENYGRKEISYEVTKK